MEKSETYDFDAIEMQNSMCDRGIPLVCEVNFDRKHGRVIHCAHYDYGELEGAELEWVDLEFIRMGYRPIEPMTYASHT